MDELTVRVLTNIEHHVAWELLIVAYFFFAGLSIGAYLLAALDTVLGWKRFAFLTRPALLSAIVFALLTPAAALAHLGQPSRFWYTLIHFHWTSPMSWGTYILVIYILALMVHGTMGYWRDLLRRKETARGLNRLLLHMLTLGGLAPDTLESRWWRWMYIGSGLVALLAIPHFGYTGIELGIVESRVLWHSPLNAVMFLLSGILSGMAFVIWLWLLTSTQTGEADPSTVDRLRELGRLTGLGLLLFAGLALLQLITSVYSGRDARVALELLTLGSMGWIFTGLGMGAGTVLPMILLLWPKASRVRLAIACLLVIVGSFATKYGFVIGGQLVPRTEAGILHYSPSSEEWLRLAGVTGLGVLLFVVGYAALPMDPSRVKLPLSRRLSPTRRRLLLATALGSAGLFFGGYGQVFAFLFRERGRPNPPDPLETPDQIRYSGCLMCHGECGIRCKVVDGRLVKIDGNPYHPNTLEDFLPYDTAPNEAVRSVGKVCAKGQSGVQTVYDPHRLTTPLKRSGPRGSGRWTAISWDQALNEIIEGGQLFAQVPGEESRHVEGLRALRILADRQAVMDDWKQVEQGRLSHEAFRRKYHDVLIDPDAPELGPKVNQVVFAIGRANHGRKEFTDRFFRDALGTINYHNEHTSICELSHHIAWKLATGGKKSHLKPDIMGAEFVIFFGASPLEAEFPMQTMARKVVEAVQGGRFRYVLVDPRFSNSAAKAWRWVPIRPGTDGALAMGMIRWMIEHDRIDRRFLENTTPEAAHSDGEPSWSDASYLVRLDTGAYLRTADIGLPGDGYVVIANEQPVPHDRVEHGELDVSQTVNGIACRSAFGLVKDEAFRHSIDEWAAICGIEPSTIEELAREFTAHGKKAAAEFYRGPAQHTNGTASALAIIALNFLIGNIDWKGGLAVGGGHWHELGDKPGQPYPMKRLHPGKVDAWGVPLSREGVRYEDSTEFRKNGYPATRPWFPLTKDIWQELFAGMATGYPYPIKAFFLLKGAPSYSTPGMKQVIEETLRDPNKVPLFVAFDIVMGETSALADYILPDVTIYDGQWATPHVAPTILTKTSHIRQPVIPKVHLETRAVEDVLIDMAIRMGLPGFGPNGFGPGLPLEKQEDWYLKLVANIAYGDHPGDAVPGATEQDRIAYVLARGGRFEPKEKAYDGPYLGHRYAGLCHLYSEAAGTTIDAMTGRRFSGVPHYEPARDAKGEPLPSSPDYPFQLITYKLPFHTQSRTMANAYLRELMPENAIEINPADAVRLGIRQGMLVKVISPSWPDGIVGPAQLLEGIRPGVVAISHHFGHSQYGARSFVIDGVPQPADPERANGVHPNPLMQIDPAIGVSCLQDLVGGSASFYDTFVRVEPVESGAERPAG